ncbi:hypothetical protein KP509_21G052600 [Ceratopteris richardii]|uniref:Uncharacterized protein n=1 Tax=Ceratopteris richardii TaxID=49495 RepID=A0A8T2S9Y3_CERRI|nr:hypothetical protein KP509_21G052600 [Ceratopteris richardii]
MFNLCSLATVCAIFFLLLFLFCSVIHLLLQCPKHMKQQQQQQQNPLYEYVYRMSPIMSGHDFLTCIAKQAPLQAYKSHDISRNPAIQPLKKALCILDVSSAFVDICSQK